jgi:mannose-6-phosphate isomerase-like protein (cupin superfamily)
MDVEPDAASRVRCHVLGISSMDTTRLPAAPTVTAPDGSDVRVLLATEHGSFAHFELAGGQVSIPMAHRTVEEIWFFLGGRGEMWRDGETVDVGPDVCITIPVRTPFQFRAHGTQPLQAVAVTMPPWPGAGEAMEAEGPWAPTVARG